MTVSGLGTGFPLFLSPLNSIFPSSNEVKKYTQWPNRALGSQGQGGVKTHNSVDNTQGYNHCAKESSGLLKRLNKHRVTI